MVEAIVGKWKSDVSKTTGFQEFREAIGNPEFWPSEPETVSLDISKQGDEWTVTNQSGGKPAHTVTFKEGEKKTSKGLDGSEVEVEGHVEGDKWVVVINAGGKEIQSSAHIENGQLVQEQRVKGVTLSSRFNRV